MDSFLEFSLCIVGGESGRGVAFEVFIVVSLRDGSREES
jgi:hypothetical protein